MQRRCAIAIMAKAPRAGRIKTRLSPLLTPEEASELGCCFLGDMTAMLAQLARQLPVDPYIAFAPAGSEGAFAGIVAPGTRFVLADGTLPVPSGVEGFGQCLLQAAQGLFDQGYGAVGLLNSDSPSLPAAFPAEAVARLLEPGDRVVLGPAEDGGYYLIGMTAPNAHLFTAIDWSTGRVAEQTRMRAREVGLAVVELPPWYDVDDAESLSRLRAELDSDQGTARAPATARWLRQQALISRSETAAGK